MAREIAWLKRAVPGSRALVWYTGDSVWHERLLVYPVSDSVWFVATPDRDAFAERLTGVRRNGLGPSYLIGFLNKGPPLTAEPVHRFQEEMTAAAWDKLVQAGAVFFGSGDAFRMLRVGEARRPPPSPQQLAFGGGGLGKAVGPAAAAGLPDLEAEEGVAAAASPGPKKRLVTTPPRLPGKRRDKATAAFSMADTPVTTEGSLWVASEEVKDAEGVVLLEAGQEVKPRSADHLGVAKGVCHFGGGYEVFVEKLVVEDVASFVPLRRSVAPLERADVDANVAHPGGLAELQKVTKKEAVDAEEECDMRVLTVMYNSQGARQRDWRSAVDAMQEDSFADWPLSGPRSMLWLMNFFTQVGLGPTLWLERHLQTSGWSPTDRSVHELRVIAEVLEFAAHYDQLNVCSLASFERLGRRWQAILEAHLRDPSAPDYDADDAFSGSVNRRVCVAPALRSHVAKELRDEAEIERQREKTKEVRGGPRQFKKGKKEKGGGKGATQDDA